MAKYRSMVNDDMGDPDGVLMFDESGFVKKRKESAGVLRQYCGSVGKVEHYQVGVFAAYASARGYAFLDKCLFVPEEWCSEEYKERREKCDFPEDFTFKTKPQMASEMLTEIHRQEIMPYKYIVADSIYGHSHDFIEAAEKLAGKIYFVSIASDTQCWLKVPVTMIKEYKYKGEMHTKSVLEDTAKKPISAQEIAANRNDYFWYRRKVSEGTKGPIEYEFCKRRVTLAKNGLSWKTAWLVISLNWRKS